MTHLGWFSAGSAEARCLSFPVPRSSCSAYTCGGRNEVAGHLLPQRVDDVDLLPGHLLPERVHDVDLLPGHLLPERVDEEALAWGLYQSSSGSSESDDGKFCLLEIVVLQKSVYVTLIKLDKSILKQFIQNKPNQKIFEPQSYYSNGEFSCAIIYTRQQKSRNALIKMEQQYLSNR